MVGYSNGAALAVDYSLTALGDAGLPRAAGLVLISPAIGVSPLAIVGRFKPGISHLPGFERAAWQNIEIELDPFKYSSFSFHAAGETHRLTSDIARGVERRAADGPIRGFPRTLIFLSALDSTVKVDAVADVLFEHLADEGHELVLFDVNRLASMQPLLVNDPGPITARLMADADRPYRLTVLTNVSPDSLAVHALVSDPGAPPGRVEELGLAWPRTVCSVSHVALPFRRMTRSTATRREAQARLPDLILLDIKLGHLDGYQIGAALKADAHTRDIPIIFISALDNVLDKVTAFSVGGVDYITKPFQREEVLARIKTHLTLSQAQKKVYQKNEQLQQEITKRKLAEELLKQEISQHELAKDALSKTARWGRSLIENISDVIAILDAEGCFRYLSPSVVRVLGYQ